MPVLPGAEPSTSEGSGPLGRTGVVTCHGSTGTALSVRPRAERLAAAGPTTGSTRAGAGVASAS